MVLAKTSVVAWELHFNGHRHSSQSILPNALFRARSAPARMGRLHVRVWAQHVHILGISRHSDARRHAMHRIHISHVLIRTYPALRELGTCIHIGPGNPNVQWRLEIQRSSIRLKVLYLSRLIRISRDSGLACGAVQQPPEASLFPLEVPLCPPKRDIISAMRRI